MCSFVQIRRVLVVVGANLYYLVATQMVLTKSGCRPDVVERDRTLAIRGVMWMLFAKCGVVVKTMRNVV